MEGERLIWPETPEPDRATFCGLPPALSVTLTCAERPPTADGVNVTLIVQALVGKSVPLLPQVSASAKSPELVPMMEILMPVKLAFPVFVNVMF